MLRRPSIPSLLRAPSLVDQTLSSRRPSLAGEKTFKVPSHPDNKEPARRRGSGLLGGPNSSFSNLLAPRRLSATVYDPEMSITLGSDDENNNQEAQFSTEVMTPVSSKRIPPAAPANKAVKEMTGPQTTPAGFAVTEDKWSNMTMQASQGKNKNKAKLHHKLLFWKKHGKKDQSSLDAEVHGTSKERANVDEAKPECALSNGSNGETNFESAPSTASATGTKPPVYRRLVKSMSRAWSKMENWLSYQCFLLGQRGGREDGTGDYDGLESVYSGFTTPTVGKAE